MVQKKIPGSNVDFFLEGEDSHSEHGMGSLVELRLRPSWYFIFMYHLRLIGVPTSGVGYTLATTGRGDHEVHKGHAMALVKNQYSSIHTYVYFSDMQQISN
jgi:hypothetical protein